MKVRVHVCREVELEVADKFAELAGLFWGNGEPELYKLSEELEAIVREATEISNDDPVETIYSVEDSNGEIMLGW